MRVDDCRLIEHNGNFKWKKRFWLKGDGNLHANERVVYVDSDNFIHNLNGPAWLGYNSLYFIHGVEVTKEGLDLYRNRLLILDEL